MVATSLLAIGTGFTQQIGAGLPAPRFFFGLRRAGVAIVVLTVAVRLLLFPLSLVGIAWLWSTLDAGTLAAQAVGFPRRSLIA